MLDVLKDYLKLTKAGIVLFALLSAGAGYALALYATEGPVHLIPFAFLWLMLGLYLVSSGSFVLNQAYEWAEDALMNRTKGRPVPAGKLTALKAKALGLSLIVPGLFVLLALRPLSAGLALLTLLLYNVFYTLYWKKRWAFSAVPGALPGALPVVIGWSVVSPNVFSIECLYLFLVLFLWQLPHFWSLSIHYKEDYKAGGFPVLPLVLGQRQTLRYMGLYLLAYLGLALASPLFFKMNVIYMFLLMPLCAKVFWEFICFSKQLKWKPFFMWLNLSVLLALYAPTLDIWIFSLLS